MKKVVVVSDSFKGTLSSSRISELAKQRINHFLPEAEVVTIAIADGGEGTVTSFLDSLPGQAIDCLVQGPFGEPVQATYGLFDDFAVIEMAQAAGLP